MSEELVRPVQRIQGTIRVPGDKSISHRALMIAAAGQGDCTIQGLSTAQDVAATLSAMRDLSDVLGPDVPLLEVEGSPSSGSAWEILVRGRGVRSWKNPGRVLDCANSGTTIRTLLGLLAACDFTVTLTGDESLRRRPMQRIADPLRSMGATVTTTEGGTAPVTIRGGRLSGIDYELPVPSAQIKTAVLYAALHAEGETIVSGGGTSRDHTERMLSSLGASIHGSPNRLIIKSTQLQNPESLQIPGDLSSAAFWLVAAAITPESDVRVSDVGINPTRTGILEALRRYGAQVTVEEQAERCGEPWGTVRVRGGDRRPLHIEGSEVPSMIDELPLVAILGAYAEGETVVEGAAELRVKESDRIAATVAGLHAIGVEATATPDGLTVAGTGAAGGVAGGGIVDAAGDHRIAMAFAVAALAASEPVTIRGWDAVAVSYPTFARDLATLAAPPE